VENFSEQNISHFEIEVAKVILIFRIIISKDCQVTSPVIQTLKGHIALSIMKQESWQYVITVKNRV
jgi:hypothetical protein